ncbi:GGDEF domain-containing protein [Thermocrinis sp.]|uniref:GGDEF domain-containing protein n=1 Tax=Thermocrinis sp. TaxID=2024383 RepID=UPI002FDE0E29
MPTPKNYERWFYIFCALIASGQKLEDEAIINIYNTYKEDVTITNIKIDIKHTIQALGDIVNELQGTLKESYEHISIKEEKLTELQEKKETNHFVSSVLLDLLMYVKDLKQQNEKFLKRIEQQQKVISELKTKLEIVEAEANIDPLTNLFNRRSIERSLEEFFNLCKKSQTSFSIVMIDLDNFKQINDNYGHHVGDLVLAKVARILRTSMRAKDIIGRCGGDEFIAIMPNTNIEQATVIVQRLKSNLEKMEIIAKGKRFKVSISAGVVECNQRYKDWRDMIKEVDALMYRDKKKKN